MSPNHFNFRDLCFFSQGPYFIIGISIISFVRRNRIFKIAGRAELPKTTDFCLSEFSYYYEHPRILKAKYGAEFSLGSDNDVFLNSCYSYIFVYGWLGHFFISLLRQFSDLLTTIYFKRILE